MGTPHQDAKAYSLPLLRPIAEFGIPCDDTGFTGNTDIHFNRRFSDAYLVGAVPLAASTDKGAQYLSPIHGSVGSDPLNPLSIDPNPGINNNEGRPAFSNPEVTGFDVPPAASASDRKADGLYNTEKVQRSVSDGATDNGTIWTPTFGALKLSVSLLIYSSTADDVFALYVFRDCNISDKVAFRLGPGAGATDLLNGQLVAQVGPFIAAETNVDGVRLPNMATPGPVDIQAASNLYFVLKNITTPGATNTVLGSISLRG